MVQNILDFLNGSFGNQQEEEPQGLVQQILTSRFKPNLEDTGNSALAGLGKDQYVDPQLYADDRMAKSFKQLETIANLQKIQGGTDFDKLVNTYQSLPETDPRRDIYKAKLDKETTQSSMFGTPMSVYDPATGQTIFAPKASVAQGNYMPPPPSGQKYLNGQLVPIQPSPRDQARLAKSTDSATAASGVERLAEEANQILSRYETSKAAPIVGTFGQFANAIGMAGEDTKKRVADYERLDKISKDLGAQALQQFGGNDTDKELRIAIETNVDPKALVETNLVTSKRKLLAARILQERPIFEEEWLNKAGSLSAPDPQTGEVFSRAWLNYQKNSYKNGLQEFGLEAPQGSAAKTPVKQQRNKVTGQIKTIYSDGSEEITNGQ